MTDSTRMVYTDSNTRLSVFSTLSEIEKSSVVKADGKFRAGSTEIDDMVLSALKFTDMVISDECDGFVLSSKGVRELAALRSEVFKSAYK